MVAPDLDDRLFHWVLSIGSFMFGAMIIGLIHKFTDWLDTSIIVLAKRIFKRRKI
jgi:hypothetical protein